MVKFNQNLSEFVIGVDKHTLAFLSLDEKKMEDSNPNMNGICFFLIKLKMSYRYKKSCILEQVI